MMAAEKFNPAKKYQVQEDVFFNDGREIELLHFIYSKENLEDIRDSPSKVLAAIDDFARTKKYLMNVGEDKGAIVTQIITERKPQVMVELGGYVGYSSILFGDAFRNSGGKHYWTLERNPEFAAIITSLIDLAGLSSTVKVAVGSSDKSIHRLHSSGQLQQIDMLFLDHYKPSYTTDLKLCEELKLVTPGTILAADNVIKPGNPPYLEYVRSTCDQKRKAERTTETINGFHEKTIKQYSAEEQQKYAGGLDSLGNPNLVYKSKLVHSYEPTGVPDGVEITRCIGEERL